MDRAALYADRSGHGRRVRHRFYRSRERSDFPRHTPADVQVFVIMLPPVPYLQFDSVTKTFEALRVVESPFNLVVPRQQFVAFLGPSGCGKTTLMRMVGGLDSPSTGSIMLEGAPVGGPDRRRGMVFQSYSSFPWLTVEQNIMFGMKYRHDLLAA